LVDPFNSRFENCLSPATTEIGSFADFYDSAGKLSATDSSLHPSDQDLSLGTPAAAAAMVWAAMQ
jgi:hypothetical protein